MKTKNKKILITGLAVLLAIVLLAVSYLLYVVLSYYRIEDKQSLKIIDTAMGTAPIGQDISLITYNIGFGAYSPDYSFFMDGGKYSRAFSKESVIENTNGVLDIIKKEKPSLVLLQEVDTDGTRSYHVNQKQRLQNGVSGYDSVFAQNYDSPYFLYPFNQPIGANKSGLMTFSSFSINSSLRRSLPIEESLYKYLDLDRCYTVSEIEAENGKRLVVYNVHLSAYTSDGSIADEQLKMLCKDMKKENDRGNYVIAAGDFNKDMLGDSSKHFKRSEGEFTWAKPFDTSLLPTEIICYSGSNAPTCRNADSPFRNDGTDFVLSVDGVLVSDNIKVSMCETLDIKFAYSDHNPVKMVFTLDE